MVISLPALPNVAWGGAASYKRKTPTAEAAGKLKEGSHRPVWQSQQERRRPTWTETPICVRNLGHENKRTCVD
jgi:hypothetical protein